MNRTDVGRCAAGRSKNKKKTKRNNNKQILGETNPGAKLPLPVIGIDVRFQYRCPITCSKTKCSCVQNNTPICENVFTIINTTILECLLHPLAASKAATLCLRLRFRLRSRSLRVRLRLRSHRAATSTNTMCRRYVNV